LKKKKLLFLGDSLIEYFDWAAGFADYEVNNLGIAGETVEGLVSRLNRIFRDVKDPDIVFIMSGINNIAMGGPGFLNIYRAMVRDIKRAYPEAMVVVHSLLPVLFRLISNEDIRSVNSGLERLASEEKVRYFDLHALFLDENGEPKQSCLLDDGVHVSGEGYGIWSAVIEKIFLQSV
jgi:lysophospholipase L1-like esterase